MPGNPVENWYLKEAESSSQSWIHGGEATLWTKPGHKPVFIGGVPWEGSIGMDFTEAGWHMQCGHDVG